MSEVELKIKVTESNVETVAKLLKEVFNKPQGKDKQSKVTSKSKDKENYLSIPGKLKGLPKGKIISNQTTKHIGSWDQFNSFFPVKAILRILANMCKKQGEIYINLDKVVGKAKDIFQKKGLSDYRGFPLSNKKSAIRRLVWHFIVPAYRMGLIDIPQDPDSLSRSEWEKMDVAPTEEGMEFAPLKNKLFDEEDTQVLSGPEKEWMADYLRKMDNKGYREYRLLKKVIESIKKGGGDFRDYLIADEEFRKYVKKWSGKQGKELDNLVSKMTNTLASSKIALLREMGIVSNKRGNYSLIGDL